MRAFNSCTKQESGGRTLQDWLTTVRDASLPTSWLSFSLTPLMELLNLFSNKTEMMCREPWHSPQVFVAGEKREWLSLCFPPFNWGGILFPQSSAKAPPQTCSHFTGQNWVTCLSLFLAENRDCRMNSNQ